MSFQTRMLVGCILPVLLIPVMCSDFLDYGAPMFEGDGGLFLGAVLLFLSVGLFVLVGTLLILRRRRKRKQRVE